MWWSCLISGSFAADFQVGPEEAWTALQDAVDAASDGDRILVAPGSYGPITVARDVEIVALALGAVILEARPGQAAVTVGAGVKPVLRGMVLDGKGVDRALWAGSGTEVTVEDAVLRDGLRSDSGGCATLDHGSVTLRRSRLERCTAQSGGGLYADGSTVVLEAVTVSECVATSGFGGGLGVDGSVVTARGVTFTDNLADDPVGDPHGRGLGGGMFVGNGSALELVGGTFLRNTARSTVDAEAGRGGAIRLWTTSATIRYTSFADGHASAYGSAIAAASTDLELTGVISTGNRVDDPDPGATYGGTVFCDADSGCAIDRSWFEGNGGADGGAVCAIGTLSLTTSMVCGNDATSDGGGVDVGNLEPGGSALISGNVIALNTAIGEGGALVVTDGPIQVRHNHLVGNTSGTAAALASTTVGLIEGLVVSGNLIAGNTSDQGPVQVLSPVPHTESWNWYWDDLPEIADAPLGPGSAVGDPLLAGAIASCDPFALAPTTQSPLVNGGDPNGPGNPDGSTADLGAFGGPDSDWGAFVDGDGDGWAQMLDCDDGDPAVHPTAEERCNGLDDDCDELVDAADLAIDAAWLYVDADGDGAGSESDADWRCAGTGWSTTADDCDDADPDRIGPVTWYTDADGDGHGDPSLPEAGCDPPDGAVFVAGDCDDADPNRAGDCVPGDRDGDGVADAVDPAPDDAGGVLADAPKPPRGCGCGHQGPSAWSGLVWVLALRRRGLVQFVQ